MGSTGACSTKSQVIDLCYHRPMRLARIIATIAGLGDRVPAPGTTVGSLPPAVAWWVLAAFLLPGREHIPVTAVATVIVAAVGVWSSEVEALRRGTGDPQPIVIDEVAGQWLSLMLATLLLPPLDTAGLGLVAALGFVAFRFFDVIKPWPVSAAENIPGGVGIVADDLVAGAFAGLLIGFAGRWLM